MYFKNREEAGVVLAKQLIDKYRYEDCIVIALNDGGALVGEQISIRLHCMLTMLLMEEIEIPGENLSFGGVREDGGFTYSSDLSESHVSYYTQEFHGYLEEAKADAFRRMNRLLSDGGLIDSRFINGRNVILSSDAFVNTTAVMAAIDFLKPYPIQKVIAVSPISTVKAVDILHVTVDEIHILDVKDNFLGVDHYYEENTIPEHEGIVKKINENILNWS